MVDDDPIFPDDDLVDGVVSSDSDSDSDNDDDAIEPLHDIVLVPKSFANPNDVVLSSSPAEAADVTVAVTPTLPSPPPPLTQPPASAAFTVALTVPTTAQKPIDDSRRLFQRLWTDEDEIELLQGFLDYTASRGGVHHHDTTAFYDQIKGKFQLEFNKNQLVEKLRRLKKKYRTNVSRMSSGKDFVFKSPHDQATFELSRKIWFNLSGNYRGGGGGGGVIEFDDDEQNPNPNPNPSYNSSNNNNNVAIAAATLPRVLSNGLMMSHINLNSTSPGGGNGSGSGSGFELMNSGSGGGGGLSKLSTTRKRQKVVGKAEEKFVKTEAGIINNNASMIDNIGNNVVMNDYAKSASVNSPLQGLVEETLKNCLSPVLKELINNAVNGATNASPSAKGEGSPGFKGVGALALNAVPLHFAGVNVGGETDEKWRKQQIMELEVYSKRLELVQEQVNLALEELKSKEGWQNGGTGIDHKGVE